MIGEARCHVLTDSKADDTVQDCKDGQSSGDGNGGQKERYNGDDSDRCFVCTVCKTQMFSASEVHEHPTLHGVGICSDCFDFLITAQFTRYEDGSEEQCRWCGEACEGEMEMLCDTCDKMFCFHCILRNCGRGRGLAQIVSTSKWSCFCCNPEPLRVHVDKLKAFLQSVPPGINSSVRHQGNTEISVPRGQLVGDRDRSRASNVNPGNQDGAATVAELRPRINKEQQNQNKGMQKDSLSNDSRVKYTKDSESPKEKDGTGRTNPPARTSVRPHQTSDILHFETLNLPLPELQGLKTLKVAFHNAKTEEVSVHNIRLPKQSTIGDVVNELKGKVDISSPQTELLILKIFNHEIYKIFHLNEKIKNVNDQDWILRAEEVPEEEKELGPQDRLIHVYHFTRDASKDHVVVQKFGEPFFLVVREKETLTEVKLRIQKKLVISDEEFSKWKFAFLLCDRPKYLQHDDVVAAHFQKRGTYGAWEYYLGLEHTDSAPKRLHTTNQNLHNFDKPVKIRS